MVQRIENSGGSDGYYVRARQEPVFEDDPLESYYISANRQENGVAGEAIGDGMYYHAGVPNKTPVKSLPKDVYDQSKVSRVNTSSRLEHAHSAQDELPDHDTIISATPKFDFMSGQGELVVEYSSRRQKVISASNKEILNWVQNELVRRLV